MVSIIIQGALDRICDELQCKPNEFFVMIRPADEDFTPRLLIFKEQPVGSPPQFVRELKLDELISI